jgi:ribose-phosphate pyrophosphokinase
MLLFAPPEFDSVALALRERIPQLCPGQFQSGRFANGELRIDIETTVKGKRCFVLATIAPPDARLLSTLLLAHTLRKDGALEVVGILLYLAYSRQDKDKPHQSLAAAWSGALMKASGFDRVITIDEHSLEDERLFPIPLISLSPARLFADALKQNGLTQATIIAPDQGAVGRCDAIKAAAGLSSDAVPYFEKQRTETGIVHSRFIGEVGTHVVLVDDILDTGATLVSACQRLFCAGVEDIQIMVTHGLFTGDEWQGLWELGVSRIFCTDTVPPPAGIDRGRILILSAVPLLAEALMGVAQRADESRIWPS